MGSFIHETACIDDGVIIEDDVKIWHFCHVRAGAVLKRGVSLGKDVYIDAGVSIGEGSRIQNGVSIYQGVQIEPWCFVGPHVIFTKDRFPRAGNKNWSAIETQLRHGCSIGAGAVIRCGVTLGEFSMVGAGAIVTESVEPHHLSVGFPAVPTKLVCACAQTQFDLLEKPQSFVLECCRRNLDPQVLR